MFLVVVVVGGCFFIDAHGTVESWNDTAAAPSVLKYTFSVSRCALAS